MIQLSIAISITADHVTEETLSDPYLVLEHEMDDNTHIPPSDRGLLWQTLIILFHVNDIRPDLHCISITIILLMTIWKSTFEWDALF